MNAYFLLGGAILLEVIGTTFMKASDGFTKWGPGLVTVVSYAASFYLLSVTLRVMPTGIAYAIWSGVGIVMISMLAWLVYGQKLDLPALLGIALIMSGVIVINVFSKSMSH